MILSVYFDRPSARSTPTITKQPAANIVPQMIRMERNGRAINTIGRPKLVDLNVSSTG